MNGSDWLKSLPNQPNAERNRAVLSAVESGLAVCTWVPIISRHASNQAVFYVCEDAVYVPLENGSRFRFQVTAKLAQSCADLLDASLITSKVSDLAYAQAAIKVPATLLPADALMATTAHSLAWNERVEKARAGRAGLFRDCGKAWVLSNRLRGPGSAVNYGYYDSRAPYANPQGIKLWQNLGARHDSSHQDMSQTLLLMKSTCEVDGQTMNVADVMTHPELHPLISNEGILKYTRQP